jgi:hypothetical protein
MERSTELQLALREANDTAENMGLLSGPAISGVSAAKDGPAALEDAYNKYLQPLRIFNDIIGRLADVWAHSSWLEPN